MPSPDVVIVGAGLIGSLCALRLRQAGLQVMLLERAIAGAQASSAAAGILAAQSEAAEPGHTAMRAAKSRELYFSLEEELFELTSMRIGLLRRGVLETASDASLLANLLEKHRWQLGPDVRVLDHSALHELEPHAAPSLVGGIFFERDAQLEPRLLFTAVAQAAARQGATFHSGTAVLSVEVTDGRVVGVRTSAGVIYAPRVVIAAGAWSALIHGAACTTSVRPARGQIVSLSTRVAPIGRVLYGHGGYLVPRPDGTLVCGSTLEYVGFEQRVTAQGVAKILAMATAMVPSLADAEVTGFWANFRPSTPDNAPLVGATEIEGLTVATGHHRSGVLLAPITADHVRDVVTGVAIAQTESPFIAPNAPRGEA
ncbi:MAG: glycine oxidase ThiO [Deltaproteobacteria bacterium]|nr:glycine oxidase ThiO [Deltaproteobacteria bacterium]